MSSPGWTLAAPKSADTYDSVRVAEITVRFPVDATMGGFMIVKRMRDKQDVGEHRIVLLDADMATLPPALLQQFLAWASSILTARGLLTAGATVTTVDVVPGTPAPPQVAPSLGPVL